MVRIEPNVKLHWQFKNFHDPISIKMMQDEATLCAISDWSVYLVIFCTAGHCVTHDESDFTFALKGVNLVSRLSLIHI